MAPKDKDPVPVESEDDESMEYDYDADADAETGAEAEAGAELAAELSQGRGSWEGSYIVQADIDALRLSNRLPAGVEARVPPAAHHYPCPEPDEYVVFLAHFQRGFALPPSKFAQDIFEFYKVQPHHLPANAFTTLSSFVTFCEAYAGVKPTVDGWANYFRLVKNVVPDKEKLPKDREMVQCGAAAVAPRKSSPFPRIKGLDSCKKWLMSWFYVKNRDPKVDLIRLPKFIIGPPAEEHNWKYEPNKKNADVKQLHAALLQLKKEGMTGDDLLRAFIARRVCPLQNRAHKMCHMSGHLDPTRMTTVELDKDEIYLRVRKIAKPSTMEDGSWEWGLEPYHRTRVAPKVRIRTSP